VNYLGVKQDLDNAIDTEKQKTRQTYDMKLRFQLPLNPTTDQVNKLAEDIVDMVVERSRGRAYDITTRVRQNTEGTLLRVFVGVNWS